MPTVSEELLAPIGPDLEICYQTFGDPDADPLLLVMGLGGPMIWWDAAFCQKLADRGFYVVRYDNRDTGRSSRLPGRVSRPLLTRAFLGLRVRPPYTMHDLADDAVALLDHLGLPQAHLVGVSMGGMIVQTVAIDHPERVLSLTSIMSTTGRRTVGWQDPRLLVTFLGPGRRTREAYIEGSQQLWHLIGSPGYPEAPEATAARAGDTWDRGLSGPGMLRQTLAILTQPDRTLALREVRVPTLVVHGDSDKMVHVSGGRATANAVPGAELLLVKGMGHDLPPPLWDTFVDAIRANADRHH